jgi:hypothetical protein
MARKDEGSDKGRVKVRVIEFELDGSNQTLRDSIRDIVGAVGKMTTNSWTTPLTLAPPPRKRQMRRTARIQPKKGRRESEAARARLGRSMSICEKGTYR